MLLVSYTSVKQVEVSGGCGEEAIHFEEGR